MKCCKCDAETESELGFIKKKGLRKDEVFCAACWEYQYHTNPKKHLIEFMIPGVIVALFILATGQSALIFLANFFLLYLVFFPATVAHEFGHAIVVKLMGQDLLQVVLGRGKQLSEWKIGKSYLTLNLVPLGGVTLYAPIKLPLFKLRICLIFLAGPLVNLLIAELLRRSFFIDDISLSFSNELVPIMLFMWANYFLGVINLLPFKTYSIVGKVWSDGGNVLTVPFYNKEKINELIKMHFIGKSLVAFQHQEYEKCIKHAKKGLEEFPGNTSMSITLSAALAGSGNVQECRDICERLIEDENLNDMEKAMAYNNIAWSIYYQQDMSSMERAEECSKKAMEVYPWMLSVRSTRGAILVELGKVKEGLNLLDDERYSMENTGNQARVLCSLAIAHKKNSDEEKAQQCIDDAEALDPLCEFLQRARESIR